MSSGRIVKAKFRIVNGKKGISETIDYFGKENIKISIEESENINEKKGDKHFLNYIFSVNTNDRSMIEFAKRHLDEVEVLEPKYLRDEMHDMLKSAYERMDG